MDQLKILAIDGFSNKLFNRGAGLFSPIVPFLSLCSNAFIFALLRSYIDYCGTICLHTVNIYSFT